LNRRSNDPKEIETVDTIKESNIENLDEINESLEVNDEESNGISKLSKPKVSKLSKSGNLRKLSKSSRVRGKSSSLSLKKNFQDAFISLVPEKVREAHAKSLIAKKNAQLIKQNRSKALAKSLSLNSNLDEENMAIGFSDVIFVDEISEKPIDMDSSVEVNDEILEVNTPKKSSIFGLRKSKSNVAGSKALKRRRNAPVTAADLIKNRQYAISKALLKNRRNAVVLAEEIPVEDFSAAPLSADFESKPTVFKTSNSVENTKESSLSNTISELPGEENEINEESGEDIELELIPTRRHEEKKALHRAKKPMRKLKNKPSAERFAKQIKKRSNFQVKPKAVKINSRRAQPLSLSQKARLSSSVKNA